jgi:hypothetical protein
MVATGCDAITGGGTIVVGAACTITRAHWSRADVVGDDSARLIINGNTATPAYTLNLTGSTPSTTRVTGLSIALNAGDLIAVSLAGSTGNVPGNTAIAFVCEPTPAQATTPF